MQLSMLDSDIPILLIPSPSDLVTFSCIVDVGMSHEIKGEYGFAHAVEHMLFAGTKNRKWDAIENVWKDNGAYVNAYTHSVHTVYHAEVLQAYWKSVLRMLLECVTEPTFPVTRWEQIEKPAILSELADLEESPVRCLTEDLFASGLGKYHIPLIDSAENLKETAVQQLQNFYSKTYSRAPVTIIVVGDLSMVEVKSIVSKYFSRKIVRTSLPLVLPDNFNYDELIKDGARSTEVVVGVKPLPGPISLRRLIARSLALAIFNTYLREELREKRGLCYNVEADTDELFPQREFLIIHSSCVLGEGSRLTLHLKRALKAVAKEALDSKEIKRAKRDWQRSLEAQRFNGDDLSDWAFTLWTHRIIQHPLQVLHSIVKKITAKEIHKELVSFSSPIKIGRLQ